MLNGVLSAKHVSSNGRAVRVVSTSLIFDPPWLWLSETNPKIKDAFVVLDQLKSFRTPVNLEYRTKLPFNFYKDLRSY